MASQRYASVALTLITVTVTDGNSNIMLLLPSKTVWHITIDLLGTSTTVQGGGVTVLKCAHKQVLTPMKLFCTAGYCDTFPALMYCATQLPTPSSRHGRQKLHPVTFIFYLFYFFFRWICAINPVNLWNIPSSLSVSTPAGTVPHLLIRPDHLILVFGLQKWILNGG